MPLTASERAEIRQLLETMLEEHGETLDQLTQSIQPVNLDEPIGRLSRIDAIQGQQMSLAGLNREQRRIENIRHALRQVDLPDFGSCTSCKREIGIDRLGFQPEVLVCVRCVR